MKPNLTLLLAPAGCGKTYRSLEHSATHHARVVLLVPSHEQAYAVRGRVGPLVSVMQLGAFARRIALLGVSPRLISTTERLALLRRLLATMQQANLLEAYHTVAHLPGFVGKASALLADLGDAAVSPEVFTAAAVTAHDRDIAVLYTRYHEALRAHHLTDMPLRIADAADTLRAGGGRTEGIGMVIADGFDQFSPVQLGFLREIAAHFPLTMTLTGTRLPRAAHRRFHTTRQLLHEQFDVREVLLDTTVACRNDTLALLEAGLFEQMPQTPIPSLGRVRLIEAPDPEREVRAVLGAVSRLLKESPDINPSQIAILAREIGPYTALLREISAEYGLHLELGEGVPLAEIPPVAVLRSILTLTTEDMPRRVLLDVLRSPYLAALPLTMRPNPSELDALARKYGIAGGRARWEASLHLYAEQHPESELPAAFAVFCAWITPPEQGTSEELRIWLHDRLDLLSAAASDPANPYRERDLDALQVVQGLLLRWARGAALLGDSVAPAAERLAEYDALLRAPRVQPSRGGVRVLPVLAARGLSFRHVCVLGLSEGVFPQPLAAPALYTRSERRAWQQRGIPLVVPDPADERTLFYEAVTRASETLLLSRTRLDARGTLLERSPFLQHVLALMPDMPMTVIRAGAPPTLGEAHSATERLVAAVVEGRLNPHDALAAHVQAALAIERHRENATLPFGPHEGLLSGPPQTAAAAHFGPGHRWSITQVNDYTTCAFRFAAAHLLRVEPRTEPDLGLDPARRGQLLHAILQRAGQEWQRAGLTFAPVHLDALLTHLELAATYVLHQAPSRFGFEPSPFWEWEQSEIRRQLQMAVRSFAAQVQSPTEPIRFEHQFGSSTPFAVILEDGQHVWIRGQIDRIDQLQDGSLMVIDYKSGGSPQPLADTLNGRNVQLPIYLLAANELQLGPVTHAQFWHIRSGKRSRMLTGEAITGAQEVARQQIGTALAGIAAGDFAVRPTHGCPEYCQFVTVCRRNLRKARAFGAKPEEGGEDGNASL